MNIELFSLCDHADDNHGKLSVVGTFDSVFVKQLPTVHPHCCLALRIRFQRSEEGQHPVRIMLVDADGNAQGFKFEGPVNVSVPEGVDSGNANLVININGMPIQKPGSFYWDLVVDGQLVSRLPMYVRQLEQKQLAA